VRMFGSKETLYLEVTRRAADRVAQGFRDAIATFDGREDALGKQRILGQAYAELIADRTVLMTLQHLFSMGHDPVIGPVARECFLMTYRVVRDEAGLSPEDASSFFGRGMLINVLMTLQLPQLATGDPAVDELIACTFPPSS
jgi:TetR/AcrR family transcriptional regulator